MKIVEGFGVLGKIIFDFVEFFEFIVEMLVYDGLYFLYVWVEKEINIFLMVFFGVVVDEIVLEL